MAKSLRSKSKRSFRAKKRQEGIYAATEAARLQRLNSKIRSKITSQAPNDPETESLQGDETEEGVPGEEQLGPYWFELFGLLEHEQLDPERMQALDTLVHIYDRRGGTKIPALVNVDLGYGLPHLGR